MNARPKYKVARISLSLPEDQVEWLQEMAWRKRQPLSHYMRDVIECLQKSVEMAVPSDAEALSAPFPVRTNE